MILENSKKNIYIFRECAKLEFVTKRDRFTKNLFHVNNKIGTKL